MSCRYWCEIEMKITIVGFRPQHFKKEDKMYHHCERHYIESFLGKTGKLIKQDSFDYPLTIEFPDGRKCRFHFDEVSAQIP